MRASKTIPLLLIGTLIAGCEADEQQYPIPPSFDKIRQSSYKSQADCEKDWGSDTRDCKHHPTGGGYIGPRYIYNHAAGMPMAVAPDGSVRQLPNSYLGRPGSTSVAFATVGSPAPASVSEAAVARAGFSGGRAGVVGRAGTSSVSGRGGFGATGHAGGTSGGG